MPGGGQRIGKVVVKSWKQLDWEKHANLPVAYGDWARRHQEVKDAGVKADEVLLEDWDEGGVDGGTLTYYRLPPLVKRLMGIAEEQGVNKHKAHLQKTLRDLIGLEH